MRQQRWFPAVALAAGLFAINAVTRLVIRLGFHDNTTAQDRASIIMFALIGLALAVVTFLRAQTVRPSVWIWDIVFGAVGGMLLTILVGPFLSGDQPFSGGAGNFFSQIWLYGGFGIVGTLLGYWIATAMGRDYRSRSLTAYVKTRAARPRRIVRR
jgi:hypothetical protein